MRRRYLRRRAARARNRVIKAGDWLTYGFLEAGRGRWR